MHIEVKDDEELEKFELMRKKYHFSTTTSAIRFSMRFFVQYGDELLAKPKLRDDDASDGNI